MVINKRRRKPILSLSDFFIVLFNVTLFAGGLIAIAVSLSNEIPFGEDFIISMPLINLFAGVTLIVVSILEMFGGKDGKK